MAQARYQVVPFSTLAGWAADDHRRALDVFCVTADQIQDPMWQAICHLAPTCTDPRGFFELYFHPVLICDDQPGLLTGYFEPELAGALQPDARFAYPVYALPPAFRAARPHPTRRQIEEQQILAGRGLEIVWLDDPVAAYFLHVQGSGRVLLPDGSVLRIGYAGKNNQPYSSVGKALVARGLIPSDRMSARSIMDWAAQNPEQARDLFWSNDSYVFFRIIAQLRDDQGPIGAMRRQLTAGRSLAVDPDVVPLGAPVWIEKAAPDPINRLMIAQDIGGAIKGAQRADIFIGTGAAAGDRAGAINHPARMLTLLPVQVALRLAGAA